MSVLKYFFPSKMISTVFWIGFLPEWSRHWAAFFSIIVSLILIQLTCGFGAPLREISYILTLEAIYCFFLALISNPIYRRVYPYEEPEKIVNETFIAQIILLALCAPAINYVNNGVLHMNKIICDKIMFCNDFFFYGISLSITLLMPYFLLRFFDIMEFWPTAQIFLATNNSFFRLVAGIIPAIYACAILYIVSFLFFDLTIVSVIDFYSIVFKKVGIHFTVLFVVIYTAMTKKNLYFLFKKIGLIQLLDHYSLLNMQHYDEKYSGN